jgi:cytochrome bd-type quinol oxidase subunit 2
VGFVLVVLLGAHWIEQSGFPRKWAAAFVITVVPFWTVISELRKQWTEWRFWVALTFCFLVHLILILAIFGLILPPSTNVGMLIWFPIACVEALFLYLGVCIAKSKIEELTKQNNAKPRS